METKNVIAAIVFILGAMQDDNNGTLVRVVR